VVDEGAAPGADGEVVRVAAAAAATTRAAGAIRLDANLAKASRIPFRPLMLS
jgi:hypothetical protein